MVASLVVVCVLGLGLSIVGADHERPSGGAVDQEDFRIRDQLIATQESLLNVYRCQFDIDVHIVSGGCSEGAPAEPAAQPPLFSGYPSIPGLLHRDKLIASQESLLNVYRCRFDVDTHIVPTGCLAGKPWVTSSSQLQQNAYKFSAVSAGAHHVCGIHDDRTTDFENIVCWGDDSARQLNPYGGHFIHLAVGGWHSCAMHASYSIHCWGLNDSDQLLAPKGRFRALDSGGRHSCAVRYDELSIACWGDNEWGQAEAPAGAFRDVSAGAFHSCAVRINLTIACWGDNKFGQTDPPAGKFRKVVAFGWHSCAIRDDFTIACWGYNSSGQTDAPAGEFIEISLGMTHSCAIRDDFTIACWGDNEFGQANAPAGKFIDVSVSQDYSCAIRDDFTIACWGDNEFGQADAPAGLAPIQVVYAVPSDVEPLAGRDLAIAEEVSEIQAWFRGQTGGRHPMIKVDDSSISVITVRLSRTASEISEVDGLLLEELAVDDIYQQIGARRDTFLLIYFEGEAEFDRADTTCGWTVNGYVFFPMGNCFLEPMARSPEPAGAAELVARQIVHLLRGLLTCAPNHNEEFPWTVTDSPRDLLYSWTNWSLWPDVVLDFGNDDYYMIGESECPDLVHDPLLVLE